MISTRLMKARSEHEITYQELNALIQKHAGKLTPIEILAVAANLVGKLVAMQDQRKFTPEAVMKLVGDNIEEGNRQVLRQLDAGARGEAQ